MRHVHCATCHRAERWLADGTVEVAMEGGARQPAQAPERAAFEVWARALRGETGPVAGTCSGCRQPLVADGEVPAPEALRVALSDGAWLEIGAHGVHGPAGAVPLDEALDDVRRAWPDGLAWRDVRPGLALFQGSLLTLMLAPLALWLVAIGAVVLFLSNYGTVGPVP